MTPTPPPPPGQGDKYDLVATVIANQLGDETLARYISRRKREGAAYALISEEINEELRSAGRDDIRISHESARRWDPEGNFVGKASTPTSLTPTIDRMRAGRGVTGIPPATFQPPDAD